LIKKQLREIGSFIDQSNARAPNPLIDQKTMRIQTMRNHYVTTGHSDGSDLLMGQWA
jgi:hypothetical protein